MNPPNLTPDAPSVIPQFIAVCPSFAPRWEAHLAYWADAKRGDYIDIAELAHFIVDSFEKKQTDAFPSLFSVVEEFLRSGDPKQKEIIVTGLLEDIQTIASNRPFGPDAFLSFLSPLSKRAWAEIARQWEGKSSLMDVVRSEKKAHPVGTDTTGLRPVVSDLKRLAEERWPF